MKLLKKLVSVFLAILMIFGSFSILATAAETEFNWSIDTKFYRYDGTKWVETTKAKKGEEIKARIFLDTDFNLSAAALLYFYSGDFLSINKDKCTAGSFDGAYKLTMNSSNYSGDLTHGYGNHNIFGDMIYDGFMDEEFIADKSWIFLTTKLATAAEVDESDWYAEIDFIVNEDATKDGQFYMSVECISDYENWLAPTTISADVDGDVIISTDVETGTFSYTLKDKDPDSTLSVNNDVIFQAGVYDENGKPVYVQEKDENGNPVFKTEVNDEGIEVQVPVYVQEKDKNGNPVFKTEVNDEGIEVQVPVYVQETKVIATYNGYIGDTVSKAAGFSIPTAEAANKTFEGWSKDGSTILTADEIKALEIGYEPLTLKAVFKNASATYTQNVYTMDTTGNYGAAATTTPGSTPGAKVSASTYKVPDGFTLDTVKSTPDEVEVKEDNSSVLDIYLKRNQYKATFGDASTDVYYEATYTAPAGENTETGIFEYWVNAADESDILKAGDTATMGLADVTYTAKYKALNDVTYVFAGTAPDGVEVPAAGKTSEGATIAKPAVTAPAGYTLVWTAEGATANEDGTFTAGAGNVTLTGTWAKIPYSVTYVYAGDIPSGLNAPAGTTLTIGEAITAPEVIIPDGYKLTWATEGDVDGKMGTAPVVMTGTWEKIAYSITYSFDGAAPVAAPEATTGTMGQPVVLPELEADGWTFDGWTVSGAVAEGSDYKVGTAPVTVTGKWIKNTYTVKFFLDSAKTIPYFEVYTYEFGDPVEFPADPEILDLEDAGIFGQAFDSWELDPIDEVNADTVDTHFVEVSKGQYVAEYIALKTDIEYTATIKCANPTGGFATKTIDFLFYGDVITADDLPATEIEGYTFDYWMVNGKKVTDWVDYTVTGDVQINAFFKVNTYNATFYGNGGYWLDENNEPTIESITLKFDYETQITAPTSNPVRTGYHLDPEMPWGEELGIMDIDDVEYYAEWIANEYSITFDVEGTTYTIPQTYDNKLALPEDLKLEGVKPGYEFKGWTADGGATVVEDITTLDVPAADTVYTAVFAPSAGGVDYTVNRYFMNTDGNYDGVVPEVITLHEVAETEVTYDIEVSGFALDKSLGNLTGVVAGDGSLVLNAYYTRNKVTVNVNGEVDEYFHGEEIDIPDAPEKEGETFEKWVDENGNEVTDPYVVPNEEDKNVTITPVYTKNTYKATFIIAAEGVSNTYTTTEAKYESAVVVPAIPTEADLPAGYTFVGWAKTADATEALNDLGNMPVDGVTFYAVLAGKTTIKYNIEKYFMGTDGVTYTLDAAKSETKTDGTAGVEKTITPDTYEGFTFDADNAENVLTAMIKGNGSTTFKVYYNRNTVKVTINGKEEDKFYGEEIQTPENVPEDKVPEGNKQDGWVYGNGDPVEFPVEVGTDPIVINPNFVPADFVMTFVNGDETVQSGNQTFGELLAVPADQVLAGHTFDGWFDADGNKAVAGTTTVPSAATTYTAKFTANKYKVNFVADGQTILTGDYAFGTKISTIVPSYTAPEGYTFKGWSTTADGAVVDFTDDVTVPVNGVTYYAVIEANSGVKYTIKTYIQNTSGVYAPQADETAYGTTGEEITYAPAAKVGFTLDETQSKLVIDSLAGDGSSVIRVFYSRNQIKVTINGVEDTYYYDEVIEHENPTPDEGYEFTGWVDGEGNTVGFPMNVPSEDIVITPVYTPIKYAVTFNVDGKEYATGKYDFDTVIVAPADAPSKAGYTFEGWSVDGKNVITDLGKVVVGGNTFEAVFSANSGIEYTVNKIFQNVDGSAWEAPVAETRTGTAGETVALDKDAEAVKGFSVYSIDPASTTIAGDGSTVINVYYTRNKVSVTINGKEDDYYFGEKIEEPKDTDKEGYDFKGWVDDEGNTVEFPITVPSEDIVITPVYEAQTKSLSFVVDGTVVEGYPVTAKVDSDIAAPADPEKDGYRFLGWYAQGTNVAFNGKMPTTDVVYEAKWTAGDHTQYAITIYMMDTNGQYTMSTTTVSHGVTGAIATIVPGETEGFTYDGTLSELSKEIAADGSTVLKIYYARDLYTVTWNVDGLETEEDVYFGAAIVAPEDPAKDGYTFAGWDPEVPATMPAEDAEFKATWTESTYTITYVVNGTKETENYKYGDTVTVKAAPSVEGMSFNGWFDGNTEYVAGSTFSMPANDLIIVADFSIAVYKVTYLNADGSVFTTEMVKFGDPIPVPSEEPTKEYHVFTGWEINYDKMPAEDIIVAPIFERISVKLIPMAGSTTVIDRDNMVIYGLQEYLTESILRNDYLDVEGDGFITITPVDTGCYGTGTKVTLYDNLAPTVPVETFTIVVFGDINGDSFVQAIDCTYADEENLMITDWSQEQIFDGSAVVANPNYDLYKTMAADLNGDGIIDSTDATIIGDASIGIIIIDQVTGRTA